MARVLRLASKARNTDKIQSWQQQQELECHYPSQEKQQHKNLGSKQNTPKKPEN